MQNGIRYYPLPELIGLPISVHSAGHHRRKEVQEMTPQGRVLPISNLHFIASGKGTLRKRQSRTTLGPGVAFLCPAKQWHAFDPDSGSWIEEYFLILPGTLPFELCQRIGNGQTVFHPTDPDTIQARFEEILGLAATGLPGPAWRAAALATSLLTDLLVESAGLATGAAGSGDPVDRFVALAHAQATAAEAPLAAFLAHEDLAYDAFRRRFHRRTGCFPHGFWLRCKLARAQELLHGTDLGVAEVGKAVGIAGAAYFTQWFRRATGNTPGTFRRR